MTPIYTIGIQIIQGLQTMSPALDGVMKFFTFLGTIEFYLLLIPLVYWVIDAQLGIRILLLLIGTDFLGIAFKQLFRQPRPYWIGGVKQMGTETSYGIPSTHASDSFAVWGYLAYRLRKAWLWAVTFLLVFLISLSRLYLGVHFPQDVLGGWLLGLVAIILFIIGEKLLLPWLRERSPAGQVGIGFVASIAMILIGWLVITLIASSTDPTAWSQFSTQARSITHYFTLAGSLFGAVAGYVLMLGHARFETKGSWLHYLGRYLVGIVGLVLIYFGLDTLFSLIAADESTLGYMLRYLRYSAVTFWAIFGAPWVFLELKLASKGE
jgi:membrane-associated phospholipid phosphatase